MSKVKPQVPPKPYPAPPDVITMSKGMVHFIIEGFIRQVIAEMRKDLPEIETMNPHPNFEVLAKELA